MDRRFHLSPTTEGTRHVTIRRAITGILAAWIILAVLGCEEGKGGPEKSEYGEISGQVTFEGTWPASGTVYLSIQSSWPPTGAPYKADVVSSSELDAASRYDFELDQIVFGTYPAITVSWLDPYDPNPVTNQHILGVYGGTAAAGFMDADPVTVSVDAAELTGIDFQADFSLIP